MKITKEMLDKRRDFSIEERRVLSYHFRFATKRIKIWVENKLPENNFQAILGKALAKFSRAGN